MHGLGPVLIAFAGLAALRWNWGYGPDPLVDFGRELYVPWRLVSGDRLYADLLYLNGPLSPYWNACVFRVFGVSLQALLYSNVVVAVAITALFYRILSPISDRLSATVACLFFVSAIAFAHLGPVANYDYLTPYSHEMTHGLLLALLAFFALSLRPRFGNAAVIASGLCLGLLMICKVEIHLAATAGLGCTLLASAWAERSTLRDTARLLGTLAVASLAAPIAAFALLALAMPVELAWRGLVGPWLALLNADLTSLAYYRWVRGTEDLALHLGQIGDWLARALLIWTPLTLLALAMRRPARWHGAVAVGVFALVAIVLGSTTATSIEQWPHATRILPVALPIIGGFGLSALRDARNEAADVDSSALRLGFVVFSFVLLAKIFFNSWLHHYGFVLAIPGTLVLIAALVTWLPDHVSRSGGFGPVVRAGSLAVILVCGLALITLANGRRSELRFEVASPPDRFRADDRGVLVEKLIHDIEARLGEGSTLAVLPEGVMLNYLTRHPASTPHNNFMPPEIVLYGEQRIIADFASAPPDYIVLVHRDTSEYGSQFFGRDYARDLMRWVRGNYRVVGRSGDRPFTPGARLGAEILERKPGVR